MKNIYIYLIILIVSISCTERIDVDVKNIDPKMVVDAVVDTDMKNHFVKLSLTTDIYNSVEPRNLSNAEVKVFANEKEYIYEEKNEGEYYSKEQFEGIPGVKYKLVISNIDINKDGEMEEYTAEATMNPAHELEKIWVGEDPDYEIYDDDEEDDPLLVLKLTARDNSKRKDYYMFAAFLNDKLVHSKLTDVFVIKDDYFNGKLIDDVSILHFNQAKEEEIIRQSDKIILETYSITEGYYDFVSQFQEIANGYNPMVDGQPANIKTNISNGAIGYFAVYSITRTDLIYK
ncbi:MAG: DUF4249 domain-containing protein [Marinifilaceae bacterium]|jgi:hypothetical protein|nr:DUF4249 domain-containing protein [Marinifilaceae bacterium]